MRIRREEKTMPTEHLITVESSFPHEETVQRLEAAVREGGMTPFAHVDHSAGAAGVGLVLRPTQVLIFGNPRAGILLIQDNQKIGIDLPLRALIWQDDRDRKTVWDYESRRLALKNGPVSQARGRKGHQSLVKNLIEYIRETNIKS